MIKTLITGIVIICISIGAGLFFYGVSVENRYVDLENTYDKQTAKLESFYDKMWKTIQSQAQITDNMKADFKEIYVAIMEGRYSEGGGDLMKWIHEANPNYDQTAYLKLMTSIEAQRTGFHNEQTIMQQIVKEMNDMREKWPSKLWLGGKKEAAFEPISSTIAKTVMQTHSDDNLFLNKK